MKTKKIKCSYCSDYIVGKVYELLVRQYNKGEKVWFRKLSVDQGCYWRYEKVDNFLDRA